jgi:hypothetical protein
MYLCDVMTSRKSIALQALNFVISLTLFCDVMTSRIRDAKCTHALFFQRVVPTSIRQGKQTHHLFPGLLKYEERKQASK